MSNLKEVLSSKKSKALVVGSGLMLAVPTVLPFAAETQSAAVTSALTTVASDITATITSVAPVALGIVGIFLTWKYGMKFFKSISK